MSAIIARSFFSFLNAIIATGMDEIANTIFIANQVGKLQPALLSSNMPVTKIAMPRTISTTLVLLRTLASNVLLKNKSIILKRINKIYNSTIPECAFIYTCMMPQKIE